MGVYSVETINASQSFLHGLCFELFGLLIVVRACGRGHFGSLQLRVFQYEGSYHADPRIFLGEGFPKNRCTILGVLIRIRVFRFTLSSPYFGQLPGVQGRRI